MRREDDGLGLGEFDLIFDAISETQLLRFVAPDGALRNAGGLAGDDVLCGRAARRTDRRMSFRRASAQWRAQPRQRNDLAHSARRRGFCRWHVDAVIPVDAEAAIDPVPSEAAPGVTASEPTLEEFVAASLPADALRPRRTPAVCSRDRCFVYRKRFAAASRRRAGAGSDRTVRHR